MILFKDCNLYTVANEIVHHIKKESAVVFLDGDEKIDIAFGTAEELFWIKDVYKVLDYPVEIWNRVIYLCEVMLNYIKKSSCVSCKMEKVNTTKKQIINLFDMGGIDDKEHNSSRL